jgi:hypothetical protein
MMGEYQEAQDAEGLTATHYILGDKDEDGHTHEFFLRDSLPIATTYSGDFAGNHAHSIEKGPDDTIICDEAVGHTHEKLVIEEVGDYKARTIHIP